MEQKSDTTKEITEYEYAEFWNIYLADIEKPLIRYCTHFYILFNIQLDFRFQLVEYLKRNFMKGNLNYYIIIHNITLVILDGLCSVVSVKKQKTKK